MDRKEVARVLSEIATLLDLEGENPFKSRAHVNAARAIEGLEGDLAALAREGRLREVEGIGQGLAEKIGELVATGRLGYHEELKSATPTGLVEMIRIPGFGPKRARAVLDAPASSRSGSSSMPASRTGWRPARASGSSFTGSKQHNVAMRARAFKMGLEPNEYDLLEGEIPPHRLDADWRSCWRVHETGCQVAISPDAHAAEGIADVAFGVDTARRA